MLGSGRRQRRTRPARVPAAGWWPFAEAAARRAFVGIAGLAAMAVLAAGCAAAPPARPDTPEQPAAPAPSTPSPGQAGTPDWQVTRPGPEHAIEGFADRTSVAPGQPVRLFVSTTTSSYTVTAFRIGAYTASDALEVWASPPQPGRVQPAPFVDPPRNTVVAPWSPSLTVSTDRWQPGDYLFRLDADDGSQRFVPLTVRTPSNAGRVLIVNAVTTWQAYNQYGGYSLYKGPDGRRESRARAVSFDRPYEAHFLGAGQFLQFELPALRVAERAGVPLGYATDIDLHADPHLVDGAAAVLTLGHDEYWSPAMRRSITAARDGGVNLAFLGGNEVYRRIRFEASSLGENRVEVNYKSAAEDPAARTAPAEVTSDWRQPPDAQPESELTGNYYGCFPGRAALVVADPGSWLLQGLVSAGEAFPDVVGIEYAKVDLSVPTPRPLQVLFHSPVVCGSTKRAEFSDAVYYSTPSGAGVFSTGTQDWVAGLDPAGIGGGNGGRVAQVLGAVTTRMLQQFAAGPAGRAHPAVDNLARLGIGP
ncbi:N,N-dimethylformamidase beta subunit family domain-containing protein [Pseudonocardia adelaidensis]|uniref:N,N-dimethylformamidase beta subunit family domain-containing protein n=1 Tax=Pseudonocardia adelaidensis TaxID=648754 RepID=UPI0031E992BD